MLTKPHIFIIIISDIVNQWIIFLKIWRKVLNEIILSSACQPIVCACDRQTAYDPFYHLDRVLAFNDMIYVTEGTMYVSEDGTDYDINAGELLFLKAGIRHYGVKETQVGTSWYFAHFFLEEPVDDTPLFAPDPSPIAFNVSLRSYEVLPKKVSGLKGGKLEHNLAEIAEYCHAGDRLKRMRINNMFASFLIDVAMLKYTEKKNKARSPRVCKWLDEHYCEPFDASALEKEFFLSYKRLAAIFKDEQGISMQQYHLERRMAAACNLLKTTLLPINEIAAKVGYYDPLYFSKCFHSKYGISPRRYRVLARMDY